MNDWLALATMMLLASAAAIAEEKPRSLVMEPNGMVRFTGGPELDRAQLKVVVLAMMAGHHQPEIRIRSEHGVRYGDLIQVLGTLVEVGYGSKVGLVRSAVEDSE